MTVIDLQTMRYINLLDRVSHVKTSKCFAYNNTIIFAVPRKLISRAIGSNAMNVKSIQDQLGKRVRVIGEAEGPRDLEQFVREIVSPVGFKSIEIKDNFVILNAGSQSKAALIGRNKRRFDELKRIIQDNFSLDLKII